QHRGSARRDVCRVVVHLRQWRDAQLSNNRFGGATVHGGQFSGVAIGYDSRAGNACSAWYGSAGSAWRLPSSSHELSSATNSQSRTSPSRCFVEVPRQSGGGFLLHTHEQG